MTSQPNTSLAITRTRRTKSQPNDLNNYDTSGIEEEEEEELTTHEVENTPPIRATAPPAVDVQ